MLKKMATKLLLICFAVLCMIACTQAPPEEAAVVDPAEPQVLPTETPVPPTDTPVPPTETPEPTDTPVPPTDTPEPTPTIAKELEFGLTMVREKDGMEMVSVPSGTFLRGTNEEQLDWIMSQVWCADCKNYMFGYEQPQYEIDMDAYWIDKYEVTNAQYALCEADGVCSEPLSLESLSHSTYYGNPDYADYPAMNIGWSQARKYCEWVGGSLPSEAQWEKAAHGTDGRPFPWGDAAPTCDLANFTIGGEPCVGDTAPVGSYPEGASPYGAMDMAGNVTEWVLDGGYEYGNSNSHPNPVSLTVTNDKIIRGGSWKSNEVYLRTQYRAYDDYDIGDTYIESFGFRCVMSP
jgi:formylglycine-generating enzyme required for sulfatase activity